MPSVNIDDELFERIEQRVEASEFETVEGYVRFVLETVTAAHLALGESRGVARSSEDRDDVEERLRSLGYME